MGYKIIIVKEKSLKIICIPLQVKTLLKLIIPFLEILKEQDFFNIIGNNCAF